MNHRFALTFVIAVALIASSLMVLPSDAESRIAGVTTMDDDEGWTISGATLALNASLLKVTDMTRASAQYAKFALVGSLDEEYKVTFDFNISKLESATGLYFSVKSSDSTPCANPFPATYSMIFVSGNDGKVYCENKEDGSSAVPTAGSLIVINTWYSATIQRYDDGGIWKVKCSVVAKVDGTSMLSSTYILANSPTSMNWFIVHNIVTSGANKVSGNVDNLLYEDSDMPLLTSFVGTAYSYWVGVGHTVATDADWLTYSSGYLVGTPAVGDVGNYNVTIDGLTYPLHVYNGDMIGVAGAYDSVGWSTYTQVALRHGDVIYIAYCAYDGSIEGQIKITEYNLTSGLWATPVVVGDQTTDLNHGQPALCVDDAGYIHVFYGCHSSTMQHKRSTSAGNISAWTTMSSPAAAATYPRPYTMPDGTIWLSYRDNTGDTMFIKSTNDGVSWSSPTVYIEAATNFGTYPGQAYVTNNNGHMWYYLTWTNYDFVDARSESVYFLKMNCTSGLIYDANGTYLGTSVTNNEDDCRIFYSGADKITEGPVRSDLNGELHASFMIQNGTTNIAQACYAHFDGNWTFENVEVSLIPAAASNTISAINIEDGKVNIILHHSYDQMTLGGDIEWYQRDVNGTWSIVGTILSKSQTNISHVHAQFAMPQSILGCEDPMFVFCELNDYLDWDDIGWLGAEIVMQHTIKGGLYLYHLDEGFVTNGTDIILSNPPISGMSFTSTPDTSYSAGYSYDANVSVMGVTYSLITDAPLLTINSTTGVVSGSVTEAGTYNITIMASLDSQSWFGVENVNITQTFVLIASGDDVAIEDLNNMVMAFTSLIILFSLISFAYAIIRNRSA